MVCPCLRVYRGFGIIVIVDLLYSDVGVLHVVLANGSLRLGNDRFGPRACAGLMPNPRTEQHRYQ